MARLKAPKRVVLKPAQAHAILVWVFGSTKLKPKQLTPEDCGFAQALLVEMIDASFAMGFIEALFRSSVKIPSGPLKVISAFVKGAGKNLIRYKDKDDLKKMMKSPYIYEVVKNTVKKNFKSVWKLREMGAGLTY